VTSPGRAYASWGQDKALPEGDSFSPEFEELVADPGMEQAKVLRTIELLAERVFPALRARGAGPR